MTETGFRQAEPILVPLPIRSSENAKFCNESSRTDWASTKQEIEAAQHQDLETISQSPNHPMSKVDLSASLRSTDGSIALANHQPTSEATSSETDGMNGYIIDWGKVATYIWLLGSAVWLSIIVLRLVRFNREAARPWPVDDELQHCADQLAVQMGLHRADGQTRGRCSSTHALGDASAGSHSSAPSARRASFARPTDHLAGS